MIVQDFLFGILSVVTVVSSILVIRLQNLFRAALMLVVAFGAIAGLFVLLNAEFLAVVQILVYVGAIAVLIIFGVLLTQELEIGNKSNSLWLPALIGSSMFLALMIFVVLDTDWSFMQNVVADDTMSKVGEVFTDTPSWLASVLLKEWVLAFEAVSLLLLAAIIGAIVLVKERDQ
ncbi:MAG: NADH-quinone oxidoreductase subunit J [Chloroflexi bacterium]|nr:MAG: NADH-quinone oxidoreductase subunit J [Chloroflexota bacterium]